MILSRQDIQQILKGEVGEVIVDEPLAMGAVCWVRETPRVEPACRARVVDVWPLNEGGHAMLLERVKDGFTVPEKPRQERPALRLSRAQRAKLFDGESPHIGGTGTCPVQVGEWIHLSTRVTLVPVRIDVQRGGKWKLMYELRDTRDPVRLLRRTPPTHREGPGYELPTDPAAQAAATREAAEQSAYTSSQHGLVAEAGEAPPKKWLDVRAKAISEFDHQRRLARHAEQARDRGRERSKAKRKRAA